MTFAMSKLAAEQGSEGWLRARLGKVTASRVADATARTKHGWGLSRQRYMDQLIHERLHGAPAGAPFLSDAMQWGLKTEDMARRAYEMHVKVEVRQTGFIDHPRIAGSGASPDGLVGADGLVEIKCPNTHTHRKTVSRDHVPLRYVKQMQWQMACTRRKWCDFVSFDPREPASRQLYVRRFHSDAQISALEQQIIAFLEELQRHL